MVHLVTEVFQCGLFVTGGGLSHHGGEGQPGAGPPPQQLPHAHLLLLLPTHVGEPVASSPARTAHQWVQHPLTSQALAAWRGKLSWAPGEGLGNTVGAAELIKTRPGLDKNMPMFTRTGSHAHTAHITEMRSAVHISVVRVLKSNQTEEDTHPYNC